MCGTIPRQHQHSASYQEQKAVEWQEDKAHQGKVIFIKDRVDDGKIKGIDCPTEEMWADILTKPLQGMAYRTMRAVLINCPVNYEDAEEKITI